MKKKGSGDKGAYFKRRQNKLKYLGDTNFFLDPRSTVKPDTSDSPPTLITTSEAMWKSSKVSPILSLQASPQKANTDLT